MKHTISMILTAVIILSSLTGCGTVGEQASTAAESKEGNVLTVRVVNQSAVKLYGVAASYSANGETLGSKACDRTEGEADQPVYTFRFVPDELPGAPLEAFRLDVFAAEKAGEDYSDCGSAVIRRPQPGLIYTLALNGEDAAALTLSTEERDVEIFAPAPDLSAESLVGPWHLADDTDLETLSEVFPGTAEFGSGMEIRSDGRISWYIGTDGAMGTCVIEGNALTADVTGELDGAEYRITLRQPEPETLLMTFKNTELVWTYGDGGSLRGEN